MIEADIRNKKNWRKQDKDSSEFNPGLFAAYVSKKTAVSNTSMSNLSVRRLILHYIDFVSDLAVTNTNSTSQELWDMVYASKKFSQLNVLFEKVFAPPATSAPVERVFSSSGLLMRPHRARMTDDLLSELKCLSDMQ